MRLRADFVVQVSGGGDDGAYDGARGGVRDGVYGGVCGGVRGVLGGAVVDPAAQRLSCACVEFGEAMLKAMLAMRASSRGRTDRLGPIEEGEEGGSSPPREECTPR